MSKEKGEASVVATDEVLNKYPELYHYTNESGFHGIVSTNTLWATHYGDLNDTTEITLLREPLLAAITLSFENLIEYGDMYTRFLAETRFRAGAAQGIAKDLVATLYDIALERPGAILQADPFITSFCSHRDVYEQEHGLLSQWRGYGGTGGYCIVFDTKLLAESLIAERQHYYYLRTAISPIVYASKDAPIQNLCPELILGCNVFFREHLEGNLRQPFGDIFWPFLQVATLFKHLSFREEAEVRIVAIPGSEQGFQTDLQKKAKQRRAETLKPIRNRAIPTGASRYIIFFDAVGKSLPINRVIIGPSRTQQRNADFARDLLGTSIPVVCSETPYLPAG